MVRECENCWALLFCKCLTDFFGVVEMMFHVIDLLVGLMAFAGHQQHAIGRQQHTGGLDGLAAVLDNQHVFLLARGHAGHHIVEDGGRFFRAGIVGGEDDAAAEFTGYFRHLRAFGLVAVAAAAHHGDDLRATLRDFADGGEHILEGVGRVRVIDNGRGTVFPIDHLESSSSAVQRAHAHQHILFGSAQQHSRTIDSQQIVGVEAPTELEIDLMVVDAHLQAPEAVVQHLALEGGCRQQTVRADLGFAVLHHHHAVLVIHIREREGRFGQTIEKGLLGRNVVGKCLVEIEVVVRDVAENGTRKLTIAATLRPPLQNFRPMHIQ